MIGKEVLEPLGIFDMPMRTSIEHDPRDQIVVKLTRLDGSLVSSQQPPLQQRGNAMHGWHRGVRWAFRASNDTAFMTVAPFG